MRVDESPALEIESGPEPLAPVLRGAMGEQLEVAILPEWLEARRWCAVQEADAPEEATHEVIPIDGGGGQLSPS